MAISVDIARCAHGLPMLRGTLLQPRYGFISGCAIRAQVVGSAQL